MSGFGLGLELGEHPVPTKHCPESEEGAVVWALRGESEAVQAGNGAAIQLDGGAKGLPLSMLLTWACLSQKVWS